MHGPAEATVEERAKPTGTRQKDRGPRAGPEGKAAGGQVHGEMKRSNLQTRLWRSASLAQRRETGGRAGGGVSPRLIGKPPPFGSCPRRDIGGSDDTPGRGQRARRCEAFWGAVEERNAARWGRVLLRWLAQRGRPVGRGPGGRADEANIRPQ